MKNIHSFILLASGLLANLCMAGDGKPVSGDELLDRVIRQPGQYSQMCAIPDLTPKVPIPLFRPVLFREFGLSKKNLADLRAQREEVVPALVRRLAAMEIGKPVLKPNVPAQIKEGTFEVENSGISPDQMNGLYYEIIVGLDAVETLPELLRLEEQSREFIAKAEADPKVEIPPMQRDGYMTLSKNGDIHTTQRDSELVQLQINQRELLSVMLRLLRRQRFQPLLDSDFEKNYAAAIKSHANEKGLRDIRTPEDAKTKGMEGIPFDPIYHVPLEYMAGTKTEVPYNAKTRGEVRTLAQQFVKTVPPEKWKVNAE